LPLLYWEGSVIWCGIMAEADHISLADKIHDKLVDQMENVLSNAVFDAFLKETPDYAAIEEALERYHVGLGRAREIRDYLKSQIGGPG
jgi:hypothetical protein